MTERPPILDQAIHGEMLSLVGPGRIDHYLGILERRLDALLSLDGAFADRGAAAEVHRVVSEAGCLGFARLSADCRALDQAGKADSGDAGALAGAAAASARDTLAEIRRLSAASLDGIGSTV